MDELLNDAQETPWRKTVVALDFDRTFTSDIEFWRTFVIQASQRGHTVICVTGRTESDRSRNEIMSLFGPYVFDKLGAIVFCNHTPKRDCAANHGWEVDIWIDDFPEAIGASSREAIQKMEGVYTVYETLPVFDIKNVHPTNVWKNA